MSVALLHESSDGFEQSLLGCDEYPALFPAFLFLPPSPLLTFSLFLLAPNSVLTKLFTELVEHLGDHGLSFIGPPALLCQFLIQRFTFLLSRFAFLLSRFTFLIQRFTFSVQHIA